jgi:hypothetical protein
MFLLFDAAMREQGASPQAAAWSPDSPTGQAKRPSHARFAVEREKSVSVVIVSSVFLVLIAATLLIGGHAAIGPLLQSAMEAREAKGEGDVVFTMPDGIYCRHMSFDNTTATVSEGTVEHCGGDEVIRPRSPTNRAFSWKTH